MVKIPGSSGAPIIPPTPPRRKEETPEIRHKPAPIKGGIPKEVFELDSRAIAVRMAALATDAKARDLSFEEIVEKVIKETGLSEVQAAMEEANRKVQKEIEDELDKIKENKELMEEAAAWQELANILEGGMSSDQIKQFLSLLDKEIMGL